MNSTDLNVVNLGHRDYKKVWDIQKRLHSKRLENEIADTLILVEHNPVITMGKSGKEKNLLIPFKLLEEKGITYYEIERGGDVTYHGPGQLVGYLLFNIKQGFIGIKPFIEKIEDVIIATLAEFGIRAEKKEKMIGVWLKGGKICSIGIAVQRWISFHGFALNVNTDLSYFDYIVPCGLKNVRMTSMQEILDKEIVLDEVKKIVRQKFGLVFNKKIQERCLKELI
ncbi:MAG: lipoyl(octanoyl) transferase LipB [candidate division WOR-3 bacterium]|nr:MAG: lipoyl(octanoyl) transferase LipB [candidate division WOR-3 bacterium]